MPWDVNSVKIIVFLACWMHFINFLKVAALCPVADSGIKIFEENTNFWSEEIEEKIHENYKDDFAELKLDLSGKYLSEVHKGCGRMHNRLGVLSNGEKICIRYRDNIEQIQGEFMSYVLGKLLGLKNIIDVKLLVINRTNNFWRHLKSSDFPWEDQRFVTATRYIQDAKPVFVEDILLRNDYKLTRNSSLCGSESGVIRNLIQWSDLVIFDYLIGNFDRFVSNMYNLQWYSRSLVEPVENLLQTRHGFWLFIDNEEGLSHGYRLLEKYEPYLKKLLKNMCVFRKQTVLRVSKLAQLSLEELSNLIWIEANTSVSSNRVYDDFPKLSNRNLSILQNRINSINIHFSVCSKQHSR